MTLINRHGQRPGRFCLYWKNKAVYEAFRVLSGIVPYLVLILILAGTLGCRDQKKVEPPRE
ncbi:hypothetical protein, partial [Desulfobacter sp.]|uniref:hypothetical protein n=1 Tax=Desulfobacter sp. TaxID=2294 RepID=UPI003D0E09F6